MPGIPVPTGALLIALKDLRQRLRDRSALMVSIVLPLVLAVIYGALFGPASAPVSFRYTVADLDHGTVSRSFVDLLQQVAQRGIVKVTEVADAAQAATRVDGGAADAAFVLPAGFTDAVRRHEAARIEVIGNVDAPTATDVARSIARSYAADVNAVALGLAATLSGTDHTGLTPDALAAAAQRATGTARPVLLEDVSTRAKQLDVKTYSAAGLAVFFLFFTVAFGVSSLLDERSGGTLARLLSAPIAPVSILAGKLLASVAMGLVSMAVLIGATTGIMRISWGDPLAVAVLVLAGVLAATGVMALVASLARTPDQAGSWQAVTSVLLGLLGGAFFPVAQVGGVISAASLTTPHAWFLRGLAELAGGGGVAAVLPAAGAMLLFAAVTLGVALLRLRKVVQP
jgi:linearmycin/streptolysin S transport system permease protein